MAAIAQSRLATRVALILCIGLVGSCASRPQVSPEVSPSATYPEIVAAIDMLSAAGFQGSILVQVGDTPPAVFSHGSADCTTAHQLVGTERFDMGSITKDVTAAAILRLIEQGRISPETRLGDVLDNVPSDKANITVTQLLTHTAGFPDSLGEDETYISKAAFLALAFATPLLSAPGAEEEYSNVGYSLLAAEIEHVTGRRYEDAVRTLVLAPAGVPGINYIAGSRARYACGLLDGRRWGSTRDYFHRDEPSWFLVGNGGLLASPRELAAFFSAIWEGRVLSSRSRELFDHSIRRTDRRGRPVRVTSGSNLIFTSLYFNWPDQRTTVVIMTSDSRFPKEQVTPILYPAINAMFDRLSPPQ